MVREDHSLLALIEGSHGSGKSVLLSRFLTQCRGAATIRAAALPWEAGEPYGLAHHILDGCGATDGDPSDGPRLLVDALDVPDTLTVVVVDDAQWADIETLRALATAVRRGRAGRLLVLLAADDGAQVEPGDGFIDFRAHHVDHILSLNALTASEIRNLAQTVSGVHLSPGMARLLRSHTGGSPSSVLQVIQEASPETWQNESRMLPVPAAVVAAARKELSRCSPAALAAVRLVSVLEEPVRFEDVRGSLGGEDPLPGLDEAARLGLIRVVGAPGRASVEFTSPLTRAAVYRSIPPGTRRELHLCAAETLIDADPDGALAQRAAASFGSDEGVSRALADRGRLRAGQGAWPTAARLFLTAADLTGDPATRDDLLIAGVDALVGASDVPSAMLYTPLVEGVRVSPARDALLGYLAIHRGRRREAEALLRRAESTCDPESDPAGYAAIGQRLVLHSLVSWDPGRLAHWADRVAEVGEPGSAPVVEARAIGTLGESILHGAEPGPRDRLLADIGTLSPTQAQRFEMAAGWLSLVMDDPISARRHLENASPTRDGEGSARISLWAEAWLARTHFVLGEWDEALQVVARASLRFEGHGLTLLTPLLHWTGAQIHTLRGNHVAAEAHLRKLSTNPEGYPIQVIPSAMAEIQCAAARADYAAVLRTGRPLVDLSTSADFHQPGFWPWQDLYAHALVLTGDVDEADAFLRPHEENATRTGHRSMQAKLGSARGRIHAARGDIRRCRNTFERSLALIEDLPLPYYRARIYFGYGQTLRRAGKRREADAAFESARQIYSSLGATVYVERCDRERRAGGLNRPRSEDPTRLTSQERVVAELVAGGLSNREAAGRLCVSVKTVQYHLTRIYSKLGIRSRSELAAKFAES
ncbi:DNA-binding CsgD family transcriptional regulator [Spinactinospora alkalitolerans]|uniref:DNA-binding CsgD family transcriptional regulator n=1 Tax=Spinactinospora alkalitolerans TaxID=687207 RepID=A0A852TTY9_9ACTN|nr:LuxR family transcriptional regulator [Spinactinospora alkalitolerans]NYE47906.1 DNA-binding CsgD family transcriptional regulator [Spinactinospora alkalitolerans]